MKKTISLIFALVLCLALCACGKETETIEITTENWNEYFTIEQVETWQDNAFGEYDHLKIDLVLSIKDEYIERVVEKQDTKLIIAFSCDGAVKGANIDYESQLYTIVKDRKIEPYNDILDIYINCLDVPYVITNGDLEPSSDGDIQYIMVFENPVIERVEGMLTLYADKS